MGRYIGRLGNPLENTAVTQSWSLIGNAGTSASINFIGTSDDVDLVFKRNNIISGKIDNSGNASFGTSALSINTSGNNSAFGDRSLFSNTSGYANNGFGLGSLISNSTGNSNVAFGNFALQTNQTGNDNTGIGVAADIGTLNLNNATAIGAYSYVTQSNSLVLGGITGINGGTSVNVGINTTAPSHRLHVVGSVRIVDGTQGTGKVFTSDANGVGSWVTPATGSGGASITLTTTGTSGVATLVGTTLNIPNYTSSGGTTSRFGIEDNSSTVNRIVAMGGASIQINNITNLTVSDASAVNSSAIGPSGIGGYGAYGGTPGYSYRIDVGGVTLQFPNSVISSLSPTGLYYTNNGNSTALLFPTTSSITSRTTNFPISVNGNFADTAGNITVATGAGGASITLTTTGTSGVATLVGTTLNIPNYATTGGTSYTGTNPIIVSGSVISVNDASTSQSGVVNIIAQTFAGDKTFIGNTHFTANIISVPLSADVTNPPATTGQTNMVIVDSLGVFSKLPIPISNATHTGDAVGATVLTLATVNTNVGTFGSTSSVNTITVNGKGLVTAVLNNPIQITESQVSNLVNDLLAKQATLISGVNIKTINGNSLLGSGDLVISAGAGGIVNTIGIISANGISGTSSGGADPRITMVLGAITPTTIVATGVINGSNLSGTNTGDNATNTQYSGLISNATHTGDATGATVLTLATVNANVGTFTNANVTVNAKGLVTAISSGNAGSIIQTLYATTVDGNQILVSSFAMPFSTINRVEIEVIAIISDTSGGYSLKRVRHYLVGFNGTTTAGQIDDVEPAQYYGGVALGGGINALINNTNNTCQIYVQGTFNQNINWEVNLRTYNKSAITV